MYTQALLFGTWHRLLIFFEVSLYSHIHNNTDTHTVTNILGSHTGLRKNHVSGAGGTLLCWGDLNALRNVSGANITVSIFLIFKLKILTEFNIIVNFFANSAVPSSV